MVGIILDPMENEGTMELFPSQPVQTYNPDYAQDKADRFSAVLGDSSPGNDVLTADISGGFQDKWNQLLKAREDTRNLSQRNEILTQIARDRDPSRPVSLDDLAVVESLTNDDLYSKDVGTILERQYSEYFTNLASSYEDNQIFKEAKEEDEEGALDTLDRAQAPMQRNLIAQDILQSTQQRYDNTSWGSWGVDLAKTFVPLYTALKTRERIETPSGAILPGNNMEEQISQLYALPPEQFRAQATQIIDELGDDNILLGLEFAQALQTYSSSDSAWASAGPVIDIATTIPIGAVGKLGKGMATLGKQVATSPRNLGKIAEAAGMNKVSAIANVSRNLIAGDLSGVTTMRRVEEVADRLPSLFAPRQFMTGGSKYMGAEAQARLEVAVSENANDTLRVIQEGTGVDRLEPSQITRAASEAYDAITDMFPSNSHNIIDSQVIPASADKVTNTATMEVRFGRKDGQLFKYEATARNYAEKYIGLKTNDYSVAQDTLGGYYVTVRKPLADVGTFRTEMIETTLATPETLNNRFARALRSPDYLVSEPNVRARGLAVGGQEYLSGMMDELTQPFRGKSSSWYKEMDDMFRQSRNQRKYFSTAGDFEDAFYKRFNKPPVEDQYEAYYRYVQLQDLDYLIRDADKVKRMTAKGLEEFDVQVAIKDATSETPNIEKINGRMVDRLPLERKEPFRVRVIQDGTVSHDFPNLMAKWDDRRQLIEGLLENGYKIVQHAEGSRFTIMKDFKRSSIKLKTVGYLEGGHIQQKYDFFIRQGRIENREGASVLIDDLNLANVPTKKQADEIAKVMEEARLKVKNKDPGAQRFIDENLPISYEDFVKKVAAGQINLDVPIVATASGQRSSDVLRYESIFGKDFFDSQKSELNLLQDTSARFTQERSDDLLDVWTNDKGVVIKQDWESVLDPMSALASATRNMINVRTMEDYAIKSTNDWVQEFGNLLDVHPEVLKANPRYYLQNPPYKPNIDRNAAESSRVSMLSLFNQVESMDSPRNVIKDKVLSKVFDVSGEKARDFLDTSWWTANDAQKLIRRVAFDAKLGFWNVKQLFLQSTSIMTTAALSPRSWTAGMRALAPVRFALHSGNDEAIRGVYNRFGKIMGWNRDEFLDMVKGMKESGFASVGGSHTYLDQLSLKSPGQQFMGTVRNSIVGRAASTHTVFFKEGELYSRIVAYATAYDEFLKRNPGKVPDRFAQGAILSRAKTFTQNMTRESNARYQQGWPSVMTQFMSYQARIAEQLWDGGFGSGRKLSQAEKVRFLGMMTLLYGVGAPVSSVIPIAPTRDMLRDWMAEQGIDINQYPNADVLFDGFASSALESLVGEELDVSAYGPGGIPTIYQLFNEDKSFAEAFLGAGAGVMGDIGGSLVDMAYGYGYSDGDVTEGDLLAVFRNISTVDSVAKTWIALNSGKYLSKKGTWITNVTPGESMMSSLLGIQPERINETFAKSGALKKMGDLRKKGLREYEDNYRKAMRARDADDEDSYRIYMKRRDSVKIAYDLLPQEVNQVNRRLFTEHPIDQQTDERMKKWNRKYKLFSPQEQ